MVRIKRLGTSIVIGMTTMVVLAGTACHAINGYVEAQEENYDQLRFDGVEHLMLTNSKGRPLCLPLSDNPIAIVLKNFTEEERLDAINAIQRLDNISENLEYVVLENDDYSIKQKIIIHNKADLDSRDHSDAFGLAEFTFNENKAEINYPINIYIDESCQGIYDTNGVSLLSYVIKHEMMHTLGFADLYTDEYYNKSVMYYSIKNGMELNDYSKFDEQNIKKLYDNEYVKVVRPSHMLYTSYVNNTAACSGKEDDGMEF